jgi:hypothetical protein
VLEFFSEAQRCKQYATVANQPISLSGLALDAVFYVKQPAFLMEGWNAVWGEVDTNERSDLT